MDVLPERDVLLSRLAVDADALEQDGGLEPRVLVVVLAVRTAQRPEIGKLPRTNMVGSVSNASSARI